MRILVITVVIYIMCLSVAHSGVYTTDCRNSEISCTDLFSDLISEKFTDTYDSEKWCIWVYSKSWRYSDSSGVNYAIVGVVPNVDMNVFPSRWWTQVESRENMGNATAVS